MPILSSFAGLSAKALGFFYNLRLTWSLKTSLDDNYTCRKAIYAPFGSRNYFVFGGNSSNNDTDKYQYSANGLTWSVGTLPIGTAFPDPWSDAAYNGTTLVAVTQTHIDYTTNGSDWTVVTTCTDGDDTGYETTEFRLRPDGNIIWDGAQFLLSGKAAVGDIDPDTDEPEYRDFGLYYSTDGQSWTGTDEVSFNVNLLGYSVSTDTYFASLSKVGVGNGGYFICTADPLVETNWTKLTIPSIGGVTNFEYGNSIYLAGTSGTTEYATSEDGTTWTERALPVSQSGKIAFIGGKFRFTAGGNIYASANGIDWVVEKAISASTTVSWFNAANVVFGFAGKSYVYGA